MYLNVMRSCNLALHLSIFCQKYFANILQDLQKPWTYYILDLHAKTQFHQNFQKKALRGKCPNTEFFLVRIFLHSDWTEYGEILRISLYSVRMRENTDQKKLRIWTHFT